MNSHQTTVVSARGMLKIIAHAWNCIFYGPSAGRACQLRSSGWQSSSFVVK